jgi:hypothetical protein
LPPAINFAIWKRALSSSPAAGCCAAGDCRLIGLKYRNSNWLSVTEENNRSEKSQNRAIFDRSYIEAVEKNRVHQLIVEVKVR